MSFVEGAAFSGVVLDLIIMQSISNKSDSPCEMYKILETPFNIRYTYSVLHCTVYSCLFGYR